jgi:DNA-binding IclR family transcriptional regulator
MSSIKSSNVRAIEKGLDILDFLSQGKQSYSLREISGNLKIPKPTIHRILSTLCGLRYAIQDPVSKDYRLGFRLVELGQAVLDRIDLRKEAEPSLHQLADSAQEIVHLARLDGGQIVYLDKVECIINSSSLRMVSKIGKRNFAHSCALGKVLLAFLPKAERDAILTQKGLPERTKNTIVDLKELTAHLAIIKSQGYAVDNEENENGIRCVAAPIKNHGGEVIAGISISGPAVRITKERINRQLKRQVMETATEITKKLGYKDPIFAKGGDKRKIRMRK